MNTAIVTRNRPASYTETMRTARDEVYHTPIGESPSAIAFRGKGRKAIWHCRFSTHERMIAESQVFIEGLEARERAKKARRAELATFDARTEHKPGDSIYNSWGYDQTNIDLYVVVAVTRRFVTLQQCGGSIQEGGRMSMSGYTMPVPDARGEGTRRHAAYQGGAIRFKHGGGSQWSGKPVGCAWYA